MEIEIRIKAHKTTKIDIRVKLLLFLIKAFSTSLFLPSKEGLK